jgi:potassium-transporting ATPase KdpC subunit
MESGTHPMLRDVAKSAMLLGFMVVLVCGIYPAVLWAVGQTVFPFQSNGSLLRGPDGKLVGSLLIAQPFTRNEYFQPRPSAATYNGSASASSTLAPSNYLLRDRVARTLGPIVKYKSGPKQGQLVGPDVERWFQADWYGGAPHIVAQWAGAHPGLARSWVTAEPVRQQFVNEWAKSHPDVVARWVNDNPGAPPNAPDLAVVFFATFAKENPGQFPSTAMRQTADRRSVTTIAPVGKGADIQSIFFDMWRHEHADADLEALPGDMVTASGSGLDPHITLQNAEYQLDRVASKWAQNTNRDPARVREEVQSLLRSRARAPLGGLVGESVINVLEVNLELRARYGPPAS